MASLKGFALSVVLAVSLLVLIAGFSTILSSLLYSRIVVDVKGFPQGGYSTLELDSMLLCNYDVLKAVCKKPPLEVDIPSLQPMQYNSTTATIPIKHVCTKAIEAEKKYYEERKSPRGQEPLVLGYISISCNSSSLPASVVLEKDSSRELRAGWMLASIGAIGLLGSLLLVMRSRKRLPSSSI